MKENLDKPVEEETPLDIANAFVKNMGLIQCNIEINGSSAAVTGYTKTHKRVTFSISDPNNNNCPLDKQATIAKIKRLKEQNYSQRQIASQVGISQASVSRCLKKSAFVICENKEAENHEKGV